MLREAHDREQGFWFRHLACYRPLTALSHDARMCTQSHTHTRTHARRLDFGKDPKSIDIIAMLSAEGERVPMGKNLKVGAGALPCL